LALTPAKLVQTLEPGAARRVPTGTSAPSYSPLPALLVFAAGVVITVLWCAGLVALAAWLVSLVF
jgi:hypothetical protein